MRDTPKLAEATTFPFADPEGSSAPSHALGGLRSVSVAAGFPLAGGHRRCKGFCKILCARFQAGIRGGTVHRNGPTDNIDAGFAAQVGGARNHHARSRLAPLQ
jgi:hypothetical protein